MSRAELKGRLTTLQKVAEYHELELVGEYVGSVLERW